MPTSPRPATMTVFTGSRGPAARANHRCWSAAPGPYSSSSRRPTRPPRWMPRAHRVGRPSCVGDSNDGAPDGPEGVAEVAGGRSALDHRLVEAARPAEVLGHDLTVLGVGGVQPAPDRLGREAPVREGAHELPT